MAISGDARTKALLLHLAGERVHDIYDTLAEDVDKYADVTKKLWTTSHQRGTSIMKSTSSGKLQNCLVRVWMFIPPDFACKQNIASLPMTTIKSSYRLFKAARHPVCVNREATKELKDLLEYRRMLEMSELQSKGIKEGSNITTSINRVQKHQPGRKTYQQYTVRHTGGSNTRCRNCGCKWPHFNGCPAKGKQCKACGKLNHLAGSAGRHYTQTTKAQTHKKNSRRVNQIET